MTDCAAPRHADDPADAEPAAYLCGPCRRGLSRDLRRLPALHADLEDVLVTALQKRSPGSERGLPMNEPVSDCQSQIRHDLDYWCQRITKVRPNAPPPLQDDDGARNPVAAMAGWLHGQVDRWIVFRDWAGDMAGALAEDAGKARALLDPAVVVKFTLPKEGLCLAVKDDGSVCGERMVATIYASEGDKRGPSLDCPACGDRLDATQWLAYGKRVIARRDAVA